MAHYNNFLLDNINDKDLIDLTLSDSLINTPQKDNSNKPSMSSIENFIDNEFHKITVEKLKESVIKDIKKDLDNKLENRSMTFNIINVYKEEIETLKSEVYFLREQVKEKDSWMKSFLYANLSCDCKKISSPSGNEIPDSSHINYILNDLENNSIGPKVTLHHDGDNNINDINLNSSNCAFIATEFNNDNSDNIGNPLASNFKSYESENIGESSCEINRGFKSNNSYADNVKFVIMDDSNTNESVRNTKTKIQNDKNITDRSTKNFKKDNKGEKNEKSNPEKCSNNVYEKDDDIKKRSNKNIGKGDQKSIFILGDSIVKKMNGYELQKSIKHTKKVVVRSFSKARIRCMNDHIKPTIREENPNHIILHHLSFLQLCLVMMN